MTSKLQNIGASILWFFALVIFAAQTYRAASYYIFDKEMNWTWEDIIVAMIAFAIMFIPAKLKSIVAGTLNRVAGTKK